MPIKVNTADVVPERHDQVTVWRCVRRDGPHGVGVGVAAFNTPPAGWDPRSGWEAHNVPEVHYVISGEGILLEEGEQVELRAGDAVVTLAGVHHSLWATTDEPLVTVYVAIGQPAEQPAASGAR